MEQTITLVIDKTFNDSKKIFVYIDDLLFHCIFYYHNPTMINNPSDRKIKTCHTVHKGIVSSDSGVKINGILFTNEIYNKEIPAGETCYSFEGSKICRRQLTDEEILMLQSDYIPRRMKEKKIDNDMLFLENLNEFTPCSTNIKDDFYESIFFKVVDIFKQGNSEIKETKEKTDESDVVDLIKFVGFNDDSKIIQIIEFWKEFAYNKMKMIMENSDVYFDSETISNCPYLSMRIIKEYPDFNWDWSSVSSNGGITNIDILQNPKLPWTKEICERRLPISFFIYLNFDLTQCSYLEENFEYSNIERLISPGEIPDYPFDGFYKELDITAERLNNYINELEDVNGFSEVKDIMKNELKRQIIKILDINDGYFAKEDIDFTGYISNRYLNRKSNNNVLDNLPEPSEDDPFSLRFIVAKIKNKTASLREQDYYKDKIKFRFDKFPIKNRSEYILLLEELKAKRDFVADIEKCPFFQKEDYDVYKQY